MNNVVGVKVDIDNQTINTNHTSTGYIPCYNKDMYGEIGYKVYASLQGIVEDGYIEDGYVYNLAKNIFSIGSHIKFIVIGDIEKYLGDILDTK